MVEEGDPPQETPSKPPPLWGGFTDIAEENCSFLFVFIIHNSLIVVLCNLRCLSTPHRGGVRGGHHQLLIQVLLDAAFHLVHLALDVECHEVLGQVAWHGEGDVHLVLGGLQCGGAYDDLRLVGRASRALLIGGEGEPLVGLRQATRQLLRQSAHAGKGITVVALGGDIHSAILAYLHVTHLKGLVGVEINLFHFLFRFCGRGFGNGGHLNLEKSPRSTCPMFI